MSKENSDYLASGKEETCESPLSQMQMIFLYPDS